MIIRPLHPYPSPHVHWAQALFALCALALTAAGCVYDSSQPCGPGQVLKVSSEYSEACVCADGYAAAATGCVKCSANEMVGTSGCVCKAGYGRKDATTPCAACGANEATGATGACECATGFSRATADAPCTASATSGQGVACDTVTAPCTDAVYNHCHVVTGTAGYCTVQGCTSSAGCTGGYMCALTASPSYCRRPPTGEGKACTSDADCAGTEATYCNVFMTQKCQVQGCTLNPNDCFTGTVCCDYTAFGVAQYQCVAEGTCTK